MNHKKAVFAGVMDHPWLDGQTMKFYLFVSTEGGNISISGVEGPKRNGDCVGSCGQCIEDFEFVREAPGGLTADELSRVYDIWKRWHLNDFKAGTPAQQAKVCEYLAKGMRYDYGSICELLELDGLNPDPDWTWGKLSEAGMLNHTPPPEKWDEPYRYGHAWIREEVPADVIDFLNNLRPAVNCPWKT